LVLPANDSFGQVVGTASCNSNFQINRQISKFIKREPKIATPAKHYYSNKNANPAESNTITGFMAVICIDVAI